MNPFQKAAILTATAAILAASGLSASAGPVTGSNGHQASGTARVSGDAIKLGADFRFDGGPDVYVAYKNKGKVKLLGKLRNNTGAQSYKLPAGSKKSDVKKILLWCKQYNVELGSASPN